MEFSIKTQMDILRHTLGADSMSDRRLWGFRNKYYASEENFPLLDYMVENGLMVKGSSSTRYYLDEGAKCFYHATELGCQCLGFTPEQIKRALED
jgi:hypothetical protein